MSENSVWKDLTATLWPRRDGPDGPLPPLLLTLTLVTGLVDATSYLKLGHVFVANMTGNVVFLGFGIAGAGGISVWASLTALGSQNATARKLAVPDLTTTVLTMTLTGVAADPVLAGGRGSRLGRRALSVAAMLLGALIGGVLVLKVDNPAPLALATGLLTVISFLAYRLARSTSGSKGAAKAPDHIAGH